MFSKTTQTKNKQKYLYSCLTKDTSNYRGDKEDHFILVKGAINQENLTYLSNLGTPNFMKEILLDIWTPT
jgi:hypothetical protein